MNHTVNFSTVVWKALQHRNVWMNEVPMKFERNFKVAKKIAVLVAEYIKAMS